jgi:hypothetical protein
LAYCPNSLEQEERKAKRAFRGEGGPKKPKDDEEYKKLPEEDFKTIEVFPSDEVICQRDRLIRRMPKEGDLLTKSNYLDILFRLLHDDSIHDLRMGVNFMRSMMHANQ